MKIQNTSINDKLDKIPDILYRGVVIDYETLKNYRFFGVELRPPYKPSLDNQGRKIVGDGNEYGVYMSDNLIVAEKYYANSNTQNKNIPLLNSPKLQHNEVLSIPSVGIVYTINSKGINARQPWITTGLRGQYNNGIDGHELIADSIPPQNYAVSRIMIGRDYLHDDELVECTDILLAEKQTKEKVEMRKYRLELFANELRTLPPEKIRTFAETEQMIFRDIFGEGGVKFTLPNKIDVSKVDGIIKYLISKFYNGHLSKIDWNSLIYIEQLKSKLYKSGSPQNVDSILEILSNDIAENVARRNAFIERKTNNGETANTRAFDLRNQQMNEIYNIVLNCQEKTKLNQQTHNADSGHEQANSPEMDDFKESDLFKDELFGKLYRKYGYDTASEQEQQEFIRKYLESFRSKHIENVETNEMVDRPRKGR